jgi:hypothetical protein
MAFTLAQIKGYLDELEMKIISDDEDKIVFGMGSDGQVGGVFIRAREDGEVFDLQMEPLNEDMSNFDLDTDTPHLATALAHMLYMNYKSKFGSWEYDPSDGDIRFSVEIPLEDAVMTKKQFKRVLSMVDTQISQIAEIKTILETGEVPVKDNSDEIAQLEALLAALKGSSSSEGGDGI